MGTSVVRFGAAATWLIEALNVLTGNLDRPGGLMFPSPTVDVLKLQPKTRRGRWRSRTRGTPEFMGELPAATLVDEIETPGEGQVRALLTIAGNPVLSSPAGHKLSEALAKLDFMVSVDFYLNETTRHARVILPPVGPFEHDHFDLVFQIVAARNTARWSPKVFDAPPDARTDGDILLELAARLNWARGGKRRAQAAAYKAMALLGGSRSARMLLELAIRTGPRGNKLLPWKDGLTLGKIVDSVHGIDFGPLEPRLPGALPSPARRIDLAPEPFVKDLERVRAALGEPIPELHLIGRRELRTNNSWSHNLPSLVKGPDRCVLYIHPADAAARGLADGDLARVASRVGAVEVAAKVTEDVMPGVVSLPHGYGHGLPETRMKVAAEHAGVSVNDLTDPAEIDPLSGNAVLSGVPVTVARAAASTASAA